MKYLKVFTDFEEAMEPLSDAEKGRLFVAMLRYARTGETLPLSGNERFLWNTAKLNIDREIISSRKNAESGSKGGVAKASESSKNELIIYVFAFASLRLTNSEK